jgi:hypothetical protein
VTTLYPSLDSILSALNPTTCLLLLLSLFYSFSLSQVDYLSLNLLVLIRLYALGTDLLIARSSCPFTLLSFSLNSRIFPLLSYSQLIAIALTKYSYQVLQSYIQLSILIHQSYTPSIRISLQHISITNIDNCFPCRQQFDHFTTSIITQDSKK